MKTGTLVATLTDVWRWRVSLGLNGPVLSTVNWVRLQVRFATSVSVRQHFNCLRRSVLDIHCPTRRLAV